MGSSAVEFRGKGFWARDGNLEFWLHVLSEEIDRLSSPEPWLKELGDHWYQQSKIGGSGIINVGLDNQLSSDQVDQLITLNKNAMRTLRTFGDTIPLEYLNGTCPPGCYYLREASPEAFLDIEELFVALLEGSLVADTSLGIYDLGIN